MVPGLENALDRSARDVAVDADADAGVGGVARYPVPWSPRFSEYPRVGRELVVAGAEAAAAGSGGSGLYLHVSEGDCVLASEGGGREYSFESDVVCDADE